MASTFAFTMCFSAVTKPWSLVQLLVPPAVGGREERADEHLVDRRVELHPGKALGEGLGVVREKLGKIRVLEIADPVGHAEMAEVDDRNDVEVHQADEGDVGELPVVAPRAEERPVRAADRSAGNGYPDRADSSKSSASRL